LGRTGILKEDGGGPNEEKDDQNRELKDYWNLSNDDYYSPKMNTEGSTTKNASTLVIQHTTAAIELRPPFFPTHISVTKLRSFHRLVLKKYQNGLLSEMKFHFVTSIYKDSVMMNKKASQHAAAAAAADKERLTGITGSTGETCFIKNISELTAMDGTIILAEYSEQYPPLMMQTGMATKIKSYYKRKIGKDDGPPQLEYGETVLAHNSSLFLGALKPGDYLQSFENYLFRSPIYLHETPQTDFLIIRTRQGYFIRYIKDIFVVGQECPLMEVPGPNSKRANLFIKDFLQVYIFRLFHRSRDKPKRIKMEDIRKAFPLLAESSIRKRLKIFADFKRTGLMKVSGSDANWWVLKDNVRLPTEDEIRSIVSPEQCCAYYSMLAAEQRLKDAGYGEKNLFAADDEDVDNIKIDDEVKNAPWHTTRAYLDAIKGKCFLQVNGVADPTGRGEGFSYVRQPFKPTNTKQEEEQEKQQQKEQAAQNKRMVTGTDADLRRLNLKDAKKLLLKYGLPQEEIDKLKRWEIIDVVRTMSTQKAKEGSESAFSKFARGNRLTQSDAHQKFREECQRIFELQNRSLASREVLSTDDDEDSNEDSDVDEMGKNLESMLQSKRTNETSTETSNEKELKQLIMPNRLLSANNDSNSFDRTENSQESKDGLMKSRLFSNQESSGKQNRILKITRTYKNEDTGEEYTVVETIKKPLIIDAYIRIRTTKDDDYIRQAFALDEEEREQLRKERRRLQEQLRRVKRNEAARRVNESKDDGDSETQNDGETTTKKPPKKKYKKSEKQFHTSLDESGLNISISSTNKDGSTQPIKTVKCGACGTIGHSKSNRECPLFTPKEMNISHGENQNTNDNDNSQTSGFTKVQGTKLIIDKRVMSSTTQKQPKKYKKKQQQQQEEDQDPLKSTDQSTNVSKIEDITGESPSSSPLKKKIILTIPKDKLNKNKTVKPLKLNKLKQQLEKQSLKLQQNSLQIPKKTIHLKQQQVTDSPIINTANPVLDFQNLFFPQQSLFLQQQQQQQQILQSQISFQSQMSSLKDKQRRKNVSQTHCDYLDKPQKKVDRRHIDPLVSFGSILENILNELRDLPDSQPFLMPVNAKKVTDYYTVIKNPIDLQTIRKKIQDKLYMNQQAFLDDMKLLVSNSELYNGSNHFIANQARNLYDNCLKRVIDNKDRLIRLEKAINPLLDDNNLIKFNYLLEKIFNEQIMSIENSYAFHKPVNKTKYKDYYDLIKRPIDLETIKNKIITKKYKTREQFIDDFNLLYSNCETYNGPNHSYTKTAEKILNTCKSAINSNEQLGNLEIAIESSLLIGDAMRNSIDMTDSESNLVTVSSLHENESNDNNVFSANLLATLSKTSLNAAMSSQSMAAAINYHEEHIIQNISSKGSNKQAQASSNTSSWFSKLQLNLSPQSISTSEQDIYVDVETYDDKHAVMDDLQISDEDDDNDSEEGEDEN
jgi:transcription initiation factor TFIID subunit 1